MTESTFRHPPGLYFSLEFDRKRADYSVIRRRPTLLTMAHTHLCMLCVLCFSPQGKRPMLPLPSPSALSVRAITRRSGGSASVTCSKPSSDYEQDGWTARSTLREDNGNQTGWGEFTCKLQKVAMMRFSKHMQLVKMKDFDNRQANQPLLAIQHF